MPLKGKECHSNETGHRQREHDSPPDLKLPRAINARGILQLGGQNLEELSEQEDVRRGGKTWKNQTNHGVVQSESSLTQDVVSTNQREAQHDYDKGHDRYRAGNHHGQEYQRETNVSTGEAQSSKRITRERR